MFQSQAEFERIVMPEARRLIRFARRLTGDTPSAEDLVQETLLKAWRSFRQFRDGTSARAWLYRILFNAFYGQARRARAGILPVETQRRDAAIERLELNQALDSLPVEHRTVLLLAVVEGFTCREISEILSVPMGTVMSRMSRARQSMREKLGSERGIGAAAQGQKDIR